MKYIENKVIIYILFISYFIFLLTCSIGVFQSKNPYDLNLLENKFNEIEERYNYLINNINVGDIEENNKELIYLEELKNEILQNVDKEGNFWKVDLKNIISTKEKNLLNNLGKDEINKLSVEYLKLKNEIDEYNFYYTIGKKPIYYLDSIFMRYFTFIFNSKGHQIFLTFIILSICYVLMISKDYVGFIKTFLLSCIPIFLMQLFFLAIFIALDKTLDLSYPIRIIDDFFKGVGVDFIKDRTIPLYRVIFDVFLVEFLYISFLISFIKIIDLVFINNYLKLGGVLVFLFSMVGMVRTKYSSISVFSYGRFLDIIRGYEAIYRGDIYLNIRFFSIFIVCMMVILSIIYIFKKYIVGSVYF